MLELLQFPKRLWAQDMFSRGRERQPCDFEQRRA